MTPSGACYDGIRVEGVRKLARGHRISGKMQVILVESRCTTEERWGDIICGGKGGRWTHNAKLHQRSALLWALDRVAAWAPNLQQQISIDLCARVARTLGVPRRVSDASPCLLCANQLSSDPHSPCSPCLEIYPKRNTHQWSPTWRQCSPRRRQAAEVERRPFRTSAYSASATGL